LNENTVLEELVRLALFDCPAHAIIER